MNEDFSFEEDTVEDDSSNDFGEKKKKGTNSSGFHFDSNDYIFGAWMS